MPLDPTKFNMTTDQRIVLGENLTRKNAKLFKTAQSLRKEEKLAQTYTEDGLIKIKFKRGKDAPTYTIRNDIALETLVAQHMQISQADEQTPATTTNNNNSNDTTQSSNGNGSTPTEAMETTDLTNQQQQQQP